MSPDEELRYFLRGTCLHEYGHQVIAEHFGATAWVEVHQVTDPDPAVRPWTGRCVMYHRMSDYELRIVGLAGVAAELVGSDAIWSSAEDLLEYLQTGIMELSATDAAMAGDYTEDDVAFCLEYVRALWTDIESRASRRFELEWNCRQSAAAS